MASNRRKHKDLDPNAAVALRLILSQLDARHKDFAKAVGITPSALGNILSGSRAPSLALAVRIAQATDWRMPPERWVGAFRPKPTTEGTQ